MTRPEWTHYCEVQGGWRPGLTTKCPETHSVRLIQLALIPKLDDDWKVK